MFQSGVSDFKFSRSMYASFFLWSTFGISDLCWLRCFKFPPPPPECLFSSNTLQMPSLKVYLIDPLMRIISSAFIYAKQRKTASCFDLIFSPTCVLFCLFMNFCNKTVSMISLLHTASFAIIPICSVFVFIDQIVVLFNKVTQELDCSTC